MNVLVAVEYNEQRVLTTNQLAESYEADSRVISNNFTRNRDRYQPGKHFFSLEGPNKLDFLNHHQFDDGSRNARILYLWTERGCLLHAKSLNTDKAWQVYEELLDVYFRAKEHQQRLAVNASWPTVAKVLRAKIAICHEAGLRGVAAQRFAFVHTEKELGVDLAPWKELLQAAPRGRRQGLHTPPVCDGWATCRLADPISFGQWIRARRDELGLTAREVVRRSGGYWMVRHLEMGRISCPRPKGLIALAQVLGIPLDEMMSRAGYVRAEEAC